MTKNRLSNQFLQYLVGMAGNGEDEIVRVPPLSELSQELGMSVSRLREQMEVAKTLGVVDAKPRTGIRRVAYSFFPAVRQSLSYAIELDRKYFDLFSDLRNHIEAAYWYEAVGRLTPQDLEELKALMQNAWDKLQSPQIKIPHAEHRQLHLGIFKQLNNIFVIALLEAYWEAYEAVGLNMYAGYEYLQQVWQYHQQMVDAICAGNYEAGYRALIEHKDLLYHRPVTSLVTEKP